MSSGTGGVYSGPRSASADREVEREREREREYPPPMMTGFDGWEDGDDGAADTFGGDSGRAREAGFSRALGSARANDSKGWGLRRIMKVAAIILGISLAAITVVAVLINYPTASSVFFTIFGIAAGLSLVALAVSCAKSRQQRADLKTL